MTLAVPVNNSLEVVQQARNEKLFPTCNLCIIVKQKLRQSLHPTPPSKMAFKGSGISENVTSYGCPSDGNSKFAIICPSMAEDWFPILLAKKRPSTQTEKA